MKKIATLTFAALSFILVSGWAGWEYINRNTYEFTVDSKEKICNNNSCLYMVYGTEGEVFRNEDEFVLGWRWKTDSASVQARLHVGSKYSVKARGLRISLLSMSPNIIDVYKVSGN